MREVIPEIRLAREPWPVSDDKPYKWADPIVGTRSKLGGQPDLTFKGAWPKCSCGETMSFYGQLDSHSDAFDIADCGMIVVFLCFDCFEVKAEVTSG